MEQQGTATDRVTEDKTVYCYSSKLQKLIQFASMDADTVYPSCDFYRLLKHYLMEEGRKKTHFCKRWHSVFSVFVHLCAVIQRISVTTL